MTKTKATNMPTVSPIIKPSWLPFSASSVKSCKSHEYKVFTWTKW